MIKLTNVIRLLIAIAIIANSMGMFFPALSSTFTPYYGSIAKHMVITNNWTNLILSGHDWLDKPHFPFWLTALSFKLLGINSFAYILPGFIFYLIGLLFTYKLASHWYDKQVALLAVLFTVTSLHLMLSSIDVRAEAYLIGEIMPACYYWLLYDGQTKVKYLILGAIFTALALMTKGLFVLITIISGISMLWLYKRQWYNFIGLKWIGALILSLILIFPELIALYQQFDANPQKVIFNHTHVSGIRWFFWDSQFGRFFNTGPIMSTNPPPFHYFYFVYTFLWAYLPWWPIFLGAIYSICRTFKQNILLQPAKVYFLASFFITFILFSLTKFQVDHYTNILFPFASIIAASWFNQLLIQAKPLRPMISYIEIGLAILLLLIVLIISPLLLKGTSLAITYLLVGGGGVIFAYLVKKPWPVQSIVYPSIAMCIVFVFAMLVNGTTYIKYDAGYQIAQYLNKTTKYPVIGYQIDLLSLDFYSHNEYKLQDNLKLIQKQPRPFYLVTTLANQAQIKQQFPHSFKVAIAYGGSIEMLLNNMVNQDKLQKQLTPYIIVKVN